MSTTDPEEEQRLRGLLRAAVPEAPEITPPAPVRRSRGPLLAVLAAAAAVAAIALVPVVVGGDDAPPATETAAGEHGDLADLPGDPYAASPCPDRLPTAAAADRGLPDLADVTSIRLCAADDDRFEATDAGLLVPDDALLTGFDALADDIRALPTRADPCPAISYFDPYRTSLVLTDPDGVSVVTAGACGTVLVPGADGSPRRVGAGAVADAFVGALGRQRTTTDYPPFRYAFTTSEQTGWCDAGSTTAPVVPGRTDLATAVVCPDLNTGGAPRPLAGAALETLRDAWQQAPEPAEDPSYDGYDDERASVVALTGQGDLVRLVQVDGTDGLVMEVPEQQALGFGSTAVVPITLEDLTGG